VAKAFGGGRVLRGMSSDVGGQNVDFVRQFLRNEDIPLWSEDLGGPFPRKVYFFPHTGQVLVKRMERIHNDTILNRELTYIQEVTGKPMDGDVELFS
jgi:chemotaxis protein CheD